MFNGIAVGDKKIIILRYKVEWVDKFTSANNVQLIDDPKILTDFLDIQNILYTVTPIDIPLEYEKYDGMYWNDTYDKALAMINNEPSYQIEQLKKQLEDMDYKTSKYVDGEYTEFEWDEIQQQRKTIREKIRQLGG